MSSTSFMTDQQMTRGISYNMLIRRVKPFSRLSIAHRGWEARAVHEGVQLRDDRKRDRFGAAPSEWKTHRGVETPVELPSVPAKIPEQPRPAYRRPEQPDVRDGACREDAQVSEVRGQVMAHHDGRLKAREVDCVGQRLGTREHNALGARKVTGYGVSGAMIDQRHFPAEPDRKIDDRQCVWTCAEKQNTRRKRQWQRKEFPGRLLQPPGLTGSGGPAQQLLHARRGQRGRQLRTRGGIARQYHLSRPQLRVL